MAAAPEPKPYRPYDPGIARAIAAGLRPRERLRLPEYAEKKHRLPRGEAEPGPYRLDRTPWMRGILEVLDPRHSAQEIFVKKAKQIGATEVGDIWIGYCIAYAPARMLMVQPNLEMARRHSRTRIKPLIENNPDLAVLVKPAKSRDSGNTILGKEFPGGGLLITGANSAVGLRSLPARWAFADECDGYVFDLDEEGDVLDIIRGRMETFSGKCKMFCPSTPTIKGLSAVEEGYERSNKCLFYVPCVACGEFQPLTWDQVKWPNGKPEEAEYECAACSRMWNNAQRIEATINGDWVEKTPWRLPMPYGFEISGLYSHWRTLGERAVQFRDAKTTEKKKVFFNQVLAQTWEERGTYETTGESVLKWTERYEAQVPGRVQILTAGVDVQADRLEVEVLGFGSDDECWSIEHIILAGDPTGPQVWEELYQYLQKDFDGTNSRAWWIQAVAIDSNYMQQEVFRAIDSFNKENRQRRRRQQIWAIRGSQEASSPVWPSNPQRNNKFGIPLHNIGVSVIKETIMERLKDAETAGLQMIHFPATYEQWYFDQLTSEKQVPILTRGRRQRSETGRRRIEWIKRPGQRNEVLDTFVYAWAAFKGMWQRGWRYVAVVEQTGTEAVAVGPKLEREPQPRAPAPQPPESIPQPPVRRNTARPQPRRFGRVTGWMGRLNG